MVPFWGVGVSVCFPVVIYLGILISYLSQSVVVGYELFKTRINVWHYGLVFSKLVFLACCFLWCVFASKSLSYCSLFRAVYSFSFCVLFFLFPYFTPRLFFLFIRLLISRCNSSDLLVEWSFVILEAPFCLPWTSPSIFWVSLLLPIPFALFFSLVLSDLFTFVFFWSFPFSMFWYIFTLYYRTLSQFLYLSL